MRDVAASEINAPAWTADPFDARNHLLAVRAVFEIDTDHLAREVRPFVRLVVHQLESVDVALGLQNPGDLDLEPRGGYIHPGMLRDDGIPEAREHIGNGISHIPRSQSAI